MTVSLGSSLTENFKVKWFPIIFGLLWTNIYLRKRNTYWLLDIGNFIFSEVTRSSIMCYINYVLARYPKIIYLKFYVT